MTTSAELLASLDIAICVEYAAHVKARELGTRFDREHYEACKAHRQGVYREWEAARLAELAA